MLAQLVHAAFLVLLLALHAHDRVLHLDQVPNQVLRGRVRLVKSPESVFENPWPQLDTALQGKSVPLQ